MRLGAKIVPMGFKPILGLKLNHRAALNVKTYGERVRGRKATRDALARTVREDVRQEQLSRLHRQYEVNP